MSKKFSNILLASLLVLCLVALVLFYVQNTTGMYELKNLAAVMTDSSTMLDINLLWAYLLVGVTLVLLVCFAIFGLVKNPKSLKKTGLTLGLAVIVVVASYFLASGDPVAVNVSTPPSAGELKMTDTLLVMTYILFAVAVIVLCWGAVRKLIQNHKS